jgi:hypothetical protein
MIVTNSTEIDRFKKGDLVLYNTISGHPRGLGVFLHSKMVNVNITMAKPYAAVMTKDRIKYLPPVDCEIIASL